MTEVAPDIDQREAGVGALGAGLTNLDHWVDDLLQGDFPLGFGQGFNRSELTGKIRSVVDQISYGRLMTRPNGQALHSTDELTD